MGGNLCKYAYHLLLINATFIRLVYKYNKNIKFLLLYYNKFMHINFYTRDKIFIEGLKKSHSYIKAFIL